MKHLVRQPKGFVSVLIKPRIMFFALWKSPVFSWCDLKSRVWQLEKAHLVPNTFLLLRLPTACPKWFLIFILCTFLWCEEYFVAHLNINKTHFISQLLKQYLTYCNPRVFVLCVCIVQMFIKNMQFLFLLQKMIAFALSLAWL